MPDPVSDDAAFKAIVATVRRRLDEGVPVASLLSRLRPDPPVPSGRLRDDGHVGSSWRSPQTPLLGLLDLPWRAAHGDETGVLSALWASGRTPPSIVRVAEVDWLNDYRLFHAVFGSVEADYDLLGAVNFDSADTTILFAGTGDQVVELASKAKVALGRHAAPYVRLFLSLTRSRDGRFAMIDRDDLRADRRGSVPIDLDSPEGAAMSAILDKCDPIELTGLAANGAFRFSAHVLYDRSLFRVVLELAHNGAVTMISDTPLWPVATVEMPDERP